MISVPFFGEWVDIGKVKQATFSYKLLKFLDRRAVETASGLVVLEENGKSLIRETIQDTKYTSTSY